MYAAIAAIAMLAGALTAVQIRAAQAQERRAAADRVAAAQAAEDARRRAEAEAWLADFLAASKRGQAWAAAAQQAELALADADAALAETAEQVSDEAVRVALADAAQAVRDLLAAAPQDPAPEDTAALATATETVRQATAAVREAHAAWQEAQAAQAAAEQEAARRRAAASHAGADCGSPSIAEPPKPGPGLGVSVPTEDGDGSNGNMPRSAMTPLPWCADRQGNQQWLRSDAAEALIRLNEAFRAEFGENIGIDLSYRSYADQVRARELFGSLAARPGTSNHGWGTAFDTWEWAAYDVGSPRWEWLVANGPAYGWYNLAATDPGNPEYWHYDYRG